MPNGKGDVEVGFKWEKSVICVLYSYSDVIIDLKTCFSMMKHLQTGIAVLGFVLFSTHLYSQSHSPSVLGLDSTTVFVLDTVPLIQPEETVLPSLSDKVIREKLTRLQGKIPLAYNNTVLSFIKSFVHRNREYVGKVAVRQAHYFPVFEQYLKKYNLPDELKYLSIVESALQPKAVSWASAVGLWQFIPSTGKYFGLRQDAFVDERMEVHKSTEAACIYLKQLYDMFGNWELALASYNAGPGSVRRAIRQSGNRTDFWAIYNFLPRETRSYLPMFVAVVYVMNSLEEHGIAPDPDISFIPADTVLVSQAVSLTLLAKQLDFSPETLQDMNPHLKRGIVPGYLRNCVIHLPKEKTDQFLVNRSEIMDSVSRIGSMPLPVYASHPKPKPALQAAVLPDLSTQGRKLIYYFVKNGDVLGNIADLHQVSVTALKAWNGLRSNMLWVGQKLAVWTTAPKMAVALSSAPPHPTNPLKTEKSTSRTDKPDASLQKTVTSAQVSLPPVGKPAPTQAVELTHTVLAGETLWTLARKYDVPVETLKSLNHLTTHNLKTGQILKLK